MGTLSTTGFYPEDCDATGADCLDCVKCTAEATTALTGDATPEWASAVFRRLYSHGACREMEHTFLWACGLERRPQQLVLVEIEAAVA